jgi:3-dehydroquinate synthase
LVAAAGLPVSAPRWSADRYVELMSVDKKAERGTPKFVLLEALGRACVRRSPDDALRATLAATATATATGTSSAAHPAPG